MTGSGERMVDDVQQLIVFNVQGGRYALDLRDIAEVLDPPATYPVPWGTGPIRGAMNFHGSLVTVLDLAEFLGLGATGQGGVVLVLDKRIANISFLADSVENIVTTDLVLECEGSDDPLMDRVLLMADGEIRQLAAGKILEKIEASLRS
jgi:purine-binding chemotaxis protein CheW